MSENNIDAFLVSDFYNILYLSGFKTLVENEREAWLLVTRKNTYLFSDSRYLNEGMQKDFRKVTLKIFTAGKGLIKHLQEIVTEEKIGRLAVEADNLKLLEFQHLAGHLKTIKIIPTEKIITYQRKIKDQSEAEKIREACRITDRCLEDFVKNISVGTGEKELATKMEFYLREKGYDISFDPIVAVDENSALPHYDTKNGNNRKAEEGSVVLIDIGVKYMDYVSDITRMVFVGSVDLEKTGFYEKLLSAQEKTTEYLNHRGAMPVKYSAVDKLCRSFLKDDGIDYPHSTGHGIGLEVHEFPKVSLMSEEMITPGDAVTVEPGIYLPGKWGMRIEDSLLITDSGAEILTGFSKKMIINK